VVAVCDGPMHMFDERASPGTLELGLRGPPYRPIPKEFPYMLLILAVILLIIAIAGGVIIHPILFALAIVALIMFFSGRRATV
jgi:hypothetical protein